MQVGFVIKFIMQASKPLSYYLIQKLMIGPLVHHYFAGRAKLTLIKALRRALCGVLFIICESMHDFQFITVLQILLFTQVMFELINC